MIRFIGAAVVIGLVAQAFVNSDDTGPFWTNQTPHALTVGLDGYGRFMAPCAFNGVKMQCHIDSGANGVALDRRAAARIGMNPARLRFTGWSETANGRARIACGLNVTLQVGSLVHPEFPVCVIDSDMHGVPLLGMSFLHLHRLAMEGDRLTISE